MKKSRIIYEEVEEVNDQIWLLLGSTEMDKAIKRWNEKLRPSRREKVVDFEGDGAQDVEVMEQRSSISSFLIIQSPEGEYIAIQRANGHIRAFNTLNEVLHILDRTRLANLLRLVIVVYMGNISFRLDLGSEWEIIKMEIVWRSYRGQMHIWNEEMGLRILYVGRTRQKEDLEREEE
ncbi:hypothetical protein Tco_1011642 [Tanacetum coccineum]